MCRQDPGRKFGNTLNSRKMTKATRGGLCAASVRTSLSFSVGELQLCGSTCGAFTPLRIPGPPTNFELSMNSPQHALTGGKSERGPKASSERGRTKFQHHWLEEEDENGDKLRHYIVPDKDDKYKAICIVCYKSLKVDNSGRMCLLKHAQSNIHKKRMEQIKRG